MIVYEVNLVLESDIETAFRAWLQTHVQEILELPGFISACIFDVEPAEGADPIAICVHYRLKDRDALARYLAEHSPRLRADGVNKFGNKFRAARRIMAERSLLEAKL